MNIRDKRQKEFANIFITGRRNGILYLCPRFGKCRVGIHILNHTNKPKVLIAYPDVNIKSAWTEEFELMNYSNENITFTTHLSLKKYVMEDWDLVIIDEVHLLSKEQINQVKILRKRNIRLLGLTGTMSKVTKKTLDSSLGLKVLAQYSIQTAIDEGIISDYNITVKIVNLDNKVRFGSKNRTELAQIHAYNYVIDKLVEENKPTKFLRLNRMRLIQKSIAKIEATRKLLKDFVDERVLVFCGLTDIADNLGCPSHHSKSGGKQEFQDFADGIGNHYAVVKIGNTGKTYKPLNKVIINYFDSNSENLAQKIFRCMAMEYNNLSKKSDIWIVSSSEEFEMDWLKKALEFFDENKIKYL